MARKTEFYRNQPTTSKNQIWYVMLLRIAPFVIIFLGMVLATQKFAEYLSYKPEIVGYPFFITSTNYPLYYPWSILSWYFQYGLKNLYTNYLYSASLYWLATTLAGVAVLIIMAFLRSLGGKSQNIFGTSREATDKELKKAGMLTQKGVILGELQNANVKVIQAADGSPSNKLITSSSLISEAGNGSTLVVAPPRSGKGVSSGIPTLLNFAGSLIAIDFKGENYEITSGFRKKWTHVIKWAPADENSVSFNFLKEIRGGSKAWTDANMLATTMLAPTNISREDENQNHFRVAGIHYLTGIILHVLCSDYQDKSLGGCLDFLTLGTGESEEETANASEKLLKRMIQAKHCNESIHKKIVQCANAQLARPSRERGSVTSTVLKALLVFMDDNIRKNTTSHDFSYDDFITSETPISLYMTLSFAKIDQTSMLVRLFISMMLRRFTDGETSFNDIAIKNPLLFFIDEFTALGALEFLQKAMAVTPGYGISFMIICQSFQQLNDVYGQNHQFLALCRNLVVFAPSEPKDAEMFSKMIGKSSVWKESMGMSGDRYELVPKNASKNGSEVQTDKMNLDEIMKIPYNQALIFRQGTPFYRAKKVVYYMDKRFMYKAYDKKHPNKDIAYDTTRTQIINSCAQLKKTEIEDSWYVLPLFTCLEAEEDIIIKPELIDPCFKVKELVEEVTTKNPKFQNQTAMVGI
jgi:type IV secretion system protein VirD4